MEENKDLIVYFLDGENIFCSRGDVAEMDKSLVYGEKGIFSFIEQFPKKYLKGYRRVSIYDKEFFSQVEEDEVFFSGRVLGRESKYKGLESICEFNKRRKNLKISVIYNSRNDCSELKDLGNPFSFWGENFQGFISEMSKFYQIMFNDFLKNSDVDNLNYDVKNCTGFFNAIKRKDV